MQSKCDLLIFTAGFGNGHLSVTKSILSSLEEVAPDLRVKTVDLYEIVNPKGTVRMYKFYTFLVTKLPYLFNMYYFAKERIPFLKTFDTASKRTLKRVSEYIVDLEPKAILSTFPTCTGYISQFKKNTHSSIPLITCITDVVDNNEWLYCGNDLYFVAHESVARSMEKRRISAKTLVTGIPINKAFLEKRDRLTLKEQMGYKPEERVILMMGGGLGILPMDLSFYRWLDEQTLVKVVVLTGKNQKLHKRLQEAKLMHFEVIEYSAKVPEYMKLADFLIGKSGGITLFETIASELPFIVYQPKLGQELMNCRFIRQEDIGLIAKDMDTLKKHIHLMLEDENIRIGLKNHLKNVGKSIQMDLLRDTLLDYCRQR